MKLQSPLFILYEEDNFRGGNKFRGVFANKKKDLKRGARELIWSRKEEFHNYYERNGFGDHPRSGENLCGEMLRELITFNETSGWPITYKIFQVPAGTEMPV